MAAKTKTAQRKTGKKKTAKAKPAPVACKLKEIVLEVEDTKGKLAAVLGLLATNRVNLLAYTALHLGNVGVLHLIPDSAAKANRVLKKTDAIRISSTDIVFVTTNDRIGAGALLTQKISDAGVNIHYSYATACGSRKFGAVFQTENNAKVVRVLNKK